MFFIGFTAFYIDKRPLPAIVIDTQRKKRSPSGIEITFSFFSPRFTASSRKSSVNEQKLHMLYLQDSLDNEPSAVIVSVILHILLYTFTDP